MGQLNSPARGMSAGPRVQLSATSYQSEIAGSLEATVGSSAVAGCEIYERDLHRNLAAANWMAIRCPWSAPPLEL